MKALAVKLTVCLLMVSSIFAGAQNQIEKTLVKSFNLKGSQVVVLDLDGMVEVKSWKNGIMRVQMTIELESGSNAMLKSLIKAGRYNLANKAGNDGDFFVHAPARAKEISISGKPLKDHVSYIVYAPENVTVKLADEASTQLESNSSKGDSSL